MSTARQQEDNRQVHPDLQRRQVIKVGAQGLGLSSLLSGCNGFGQVLVSDGQAASQSPVSGSPDNKVMEAKGAGLARNEPETLSARSATGAKNSDKRPAESEANRASSLQPLSIAPLPEIHREFRAAWVASVANIDWPSKPALSAPALRSEIERICTQAKTMGLNALIVQVRPSGDALFASELEPTSEYLVGHQGASLPEGFDPLGYWIQTCKQNGLEFHAWFNPYRARHASAKSGFHAKHLARQQPRLVLKYGDQWWMNPAEPKALQWSLSVIEDVVRRYDLDAVHLDDYFYPYPIKAQGNSSALEFPDESLFKTYRRRGGKLSRADWRRSHVDNMVRSLYERVHKQKPWVRVGISPFGIGKPVLRPAGIQGFSQYDQLYADVERWCGEGWLDYLAPQLYWKLDQTAQAFEVLLRYWSERLIAKRHLWPGLYTSSIAQPGRMWPASEIIDQIREQRRLARAGGHIHFSMIALLENRQNIAVRLSSESYQRPSLVPPSSWLSRAGPDRPQLIEPDQHGNLGFESPLGSRPWGTTPVRWVLHQRSDEHAQWSMSHGDVNLHPITLSANRQYVLRLLNRVGEASEGIAFSWKG